MYAYEQTHLEWHQALRVGIGDDMHHLSEGHHLAVGPHIAIEGHVLDEANVDGLVLGEIDKIAQLIVVHPPHDHDIDLQRRQQSVTAEVQSTATLLSCTGLVNTVWPV